AGGSPATASGSRFRPGCGTTRPRVLSLLSRLPQLDLVAVGIHDPRELAVLVGIGALHKLDALFLELREQRRQVVDPVVDHEARRGGAEPLRLALSDVPDGEAAILGVVLWPLQDRATPVFERQAQIVPVPGSEALVVRR